MEEDQAKLTSNNLQDFNNDIRGIGHGNQNQNHPYQEREGSPREVIQMERGGGNAGISDQNRNRNYGAVNKPPILMENRAGPGPDAFISNI